MKCCRNFFHQEKLRYFFEMMSQMLISVLSPLKGICRLTCEPAVWKQAQSDQKLHGWIPKLWQAGILASSCFGVGLFAWGPPGGRSTEQHLAMMAAADDVSFWFLFASTSCVLDPTCTVTGPSIIDFSGRTALIEDRCTYNLIRDSTIPGLVVRGTFEDRRRKDVYFLDSVILYIESTETHFYLEQGSRVRVSILQTQSCVSVKWWLFL